MPLRPFILALVALMWVGQAGADIPPRQLLAKQKEILLELGHEGISDAWYQLARLATGQAKGTDARRRVLAFYERAAKLGNLAALRLLGNHRWYRAQNDQQRREALIWIAQAALLGNLQAQNDLLLLPRMTPLSYRAVELATKEAAQRIRQQEAPVHCHSGGMCLTSGDDILLSPWGPHQLKRLEQFYQGMEMSGAKTLDAYLIHLTRTAPQTSLAGSDTATRLQDKSPPLLRRQQQTGRKLLTHSNTEDYRAMQDSLERIIGRINRHLAPEARITMEEVLQLLGDRP